MKDDMRVKIFASEGTDVCAEFYRLNSEIERWAGREGTEDIDVVKERLEIIDVKTNVIAKSDLSDYVFTVVVLYKIVNR